MPSLRSLVAGKSFVIGEMAKVLGEKCERINFASSTTTEQLLGAIIPCYTNGEVSYEWRDGTLTRALKAVRLGYMRCNLILLTCALVEYVSLVRTGPVGVVG